MLPTEAFTEAVAFLRLFDLNALLVANAMCSSLALKASIAIRWEQFPGLGLYLTDRWMGIGRTPGPEDKYDRYRWTTSVARLYFPGENEMDDFIATAFPNCIFEDVAFPPFLSNQVRNAIDRVADSVVIKGAICPSYNMSPDDVRNLIRKFRKVKAVLHFAILSDDEANEIANLYRDSGLQEFQYYHVDGWALKKVALL